jgi:hypothetical protein
MYVTHKSHYKNRKPETDFCQESWYKWQGFPILINRTPSSQNEIQGLIDLSIKIAHLSRDITSQEFSDPIHDFANVFASCFFLVTMFPYKECTYSFFTCQVFLCLEFTLRTQANDYKTYVGNKDSKEPPITMAKAKILPVSNG